MASDQQTWDTPSPRLEQFAKSKAKASAAAAELTAQFTQEMAGSLEEQQQQNTQVDENTEGALEQARGLLQSPKVKAQEAAAARAERRQKRSDEHEREQKKEPTATGVAGLSEEQFRRSAEKAFAGLSTDQAAALVEVAREAESAAWQKVADEDTTDYTPATDPDAYHGHEADQAGDEDEAEDELTGLE